MINGLQAAYERVDARGCIQTFFDSVGLDKGVSQAGGGSKMFTRERIHNWGLAG